MLNLQQEGQALHLQVPLQTNEIGEEKSDKPSGLRKFTIPLHELCPLGLIGMG